MHIVLVPIAMHNSKVFLFQYYSVIRSAAYIPYTVLTSIVFKLSVIPNWHGYTVAIHTVGDFCSFITNCYMDLSMLADLKCCLQSFKIMNTYRCKIFFI